MDDSIPTVTVSDTAIPPTLDADNLIKVFTHFLSFDVADGAASAETIIAYWNQVKAYLNWCGQQAVDPAAANRETIKVYRHYLVQYKYGRNTIALKLAAVRRFYDAAIEYGLLIYNPALGIKPPRTSTHILHQYIKTSKIRNQNVRKRAQNNIDENSEHHSPLCPSSTLHTNGIDAQSLPTAESTSSVDNVLGTAESRIARTMRHQITSSIKQILQ